MVTALLNNYRQAPRKVRVVADSVRGKSVDQALIILSFMPKRAALPIKKLIDSAIANAEKNFQLDRKNLFVQAITVDQGIVMKRSMLAARGSAHPIRKKLSKVKVVLGEKKIAKAKTAAKTK